MAQQLTQWLLSLTISVDPQKIHGARIGLTHIPTTENITTPQHINTYMQFKERKREREVNQTKRLTRTLKYIL